MADLFVMRGRKSPKFSIIIPAKDEEENIAILLTRLHKSIAEMKGFSKSDFEIIAVCDNCVDKTERVARRFGVKTIRRTADPGKSRALVDGFSRAKGDIFVMMDADLSHLPEELVAMIEKLESDPDNGLVVASRIAGRSDDETAIRRVGGIFINACTNLFFGTQLSDAINGYKIFHRHIFDDFKYTADGYAIEIELVANTIRSGRRVVEIPSYEAQRAGGLAKSKIIRDGWFFFREVVSEGVSYWWERVRGRELYKVSRVEEHFDQIAKDYNFWKKKSAYYYAALKKLFGEFIPKGQVVLEVGCGTGEILYSTRPMFGLGIDISQGMIDRAAVRYKKLNFQKADIYKFKSRRKFDYVIMADVVDHLPDVGEALANLAGVCSKGGLVVISTINPFWEPFLHLAEKLKMKMPEGPHLWIRQGQMEETIKKSGFNIINSGYRLLIPKRMGEVSDWLNGAIDMLGPLQKLGFVHFYVCQLKRS